MPQKRTESLLGLPAVTSPIPTSVSNGQALIVRKTGLTDREQQILDRTHEHTLMVDAVRFKAAFAADKLGEIHRCAGSEFLQTAEYLDDLIQQAKGTNYYARVEEFNIYLTNIAGRHMAGMVETAGAAMAELVLRPVDPPVVKKHPGLLGRIFGWEGE